MNVLAVLECEAAVTACISCLTTNTNNPMQTSKRLIFFVPASLSGFETSFLCLGLQIIYQTNDWSCLKLVLLINTRKIQSLKSECMGEQNVMSSIKNKCVNLFNCKTWNYSWGTDLSERFIWYLCVCIYVYIHYPIFSPIYASDYLAIIWSSQWISASHIYAAELWSVVVWQPSSSSRSLLSIQPL